MLHKYREDFTLEDENGEEVVVARETTCRCGLPLTIMRRVDNKHIMLNICENKNCHKYLNKLNLTEWQLTTETQIEPS